MRRRSFLAVLVPYLHALSAPQKTEQPPPRVQFWSGTVVDVSADKVIVRRSLPNRDPEDRIFLIAPETKVEGELSAQSRVVVGFVESDGNRVAHRILVRRDRR